MQIREARIDVDDVFARHHTDLLRHSGSPERFRLRLSTRPLGTGLARASLSVEVKDG